MIELTLAIIISAIFVMVASIPFYVLLKVHEGRYEADKKSLLNKIADNEAKIALLEEKICTDIESVKENLESKINNVDYRITRQVGQDTESWRF